MRLPSRERLVEWRQMLTLAARTVAGRRFYLAAILPLAWPIVVVIQAAFGGREAFTSAAAQNQIIGLPLTLLAIGLFGGVIAGEMDRRTLEIAYTVPGGAHRVWLSKIAAIGMILLASTFLLAIVARVLCGPYPIGAIYGAMQGALVYGALSMSFSTWARSEATGALIVGAVLLLNYVLTGFGNIQLRVSPFFNPESPGLANEVARDVLSWTIQNRIGMALVVAVVVALTFSQAEKREKLLG